jgi:hypothetical protein
MSCLELCGYAFLFGIVYFAVVLLIGAFVHAGMGEEE